MKTKNEILNSDNDNTNTYADTKNESLILGHMYKMGHPSNRYYEYVHPVLDVTRMKVKEFEEFRNIDNTNMIVTNILELRNGSKLGILKRHDGKPFINNINTIYADAIKSLSSKEIVPI